MGTIAPQTRCAFRITFVKMHNIWALCLLIGILQAASVSSNSGHLKSNINEVALDDTFDIDQNSNENQWLGSQFTDIDQDSTNEHESKHSETQNVDNDENKGWLYRVRRELGKFFGVSHEKTKKINKRAHKKELLHVKPAQKTPSKFLLNNNKHNKRQSFNDPEYEGSGGFIDENPDEPLEFWQTQFIINEPWNDAFANQSSKEFKDLNQQLEMELREVYQLSLGDDDYTTRSWLLNVLRTQDIYKVYVVVQIQLPVHVTNFGDTLLQHISTYQRLSALGAGIDGSYYFRSVRDVTSESENESTTTKITSTTSEPREENSISNAEGEQQNGFNGSETNAVEEHNIENYQCVLNQYGVEIFRCHNGIEIDCYKRCDNLVDCDDESDEEPSICQALNEVDERTNKVIPNANPQYCANGDFYCTSGQVIPCALICDNNNDCDDGSDENEFCAQVVHEQSTAKTEVHEEESYDNKNATGEGVQPTYEIEASGDDSNPWSATTERDLSQCRGDATFTCTQSNTQICDEQQCDGQFDCPYGEDEQNCPNYPVENEEDNSPAWNPNEIACSEYEFKCDNRCIPNYFRCNGVSECIDSTDEQDCPKPEVRECQSHEYRCHSGDCIDGRRRCDHARDCPDGDDEDETCQAVQNTPEDCTSDQFFCDNECHSNSIRCNGYTDCADRSDEQNCERNQYSTRAPPSYPTYPCPQHTCPNGRCYSESERCDGTRDCDDGADELNCCAANQFRCRNGDCVPEHYQCNGYPECRDGSDEEACSDPVPTNNRCSATQFRCENGQCINAVAKCDGHTDCYDNSDELYCPPSQPTVAPHLSLKTYPDSQIIKQSNEVIFRCRDEGPLRAKVKWSRPGGSPLPAGAIDMNGRLEIPNIRVEDSGSYVCEAVGYPRHLPGQQVSVHLTVERFNPINQRPPSACHSTQATCMNGECIDKTQICDGIPHCSDGSDEHSCSHGRKCHPNQFMCRNSKCVDRIWRCDGENDCGDNSDEESCDVQPSGAPCRYDEFQCRSGHCIPKSFQCDDTNDCVDGSDEIGCMIPAPIRPPPPRMNLQEGAELNLTCVATGVPIPEIVWRLNWGHVPDKCVSKSHGGTGTLYCPNMETADSGAYSCEIINSKGTTFVTPDTLVTVEAPVRGDVCPAGFFNMLARYREDCISCFCFGISKNCHSANLYNFAIQPPISSRRIVNVALSPFNNIAINEAPSANVINLHHGVQFRASNVLYGAREAPYLALPNDYMGSQLKSYGGFLRYDVNFVGTGRPTQSPDVILTGNGYTLVHRSRTPLQANINNQMSVQFISGPWAKPDGRMATREELMMTLANVENILIRLSYIDATEREVELTNIVMDSAGLQDQGLGSASLVEHCTCPVGYVGDSCEACAPGYVRQSGGPWLGRCVPQQPELCSQGTYGDPRRGIPCRECPCPQTGSNNYANGCQMGPDGEVNCNCKEGYAGRRCEICAPGYQGNPLIPGIGCSLIPESTCNAEGTYYPYPNGTCECKPLVVGPRCDQCAPESFHLNSFTYTGCIECFCSSLTNQCTSSSWYRDQISSSFGRSRAPHGFDLIRDYETAQPSSVEFSQGETSLQFSQQSTSEPLYWSLPAQFLGNKITAYGGKLNYTLSYNPLPGGLMSRNNAPDVVIKSGEDLTIIHYRKAGVNPSQSSSYAVPIIESAWQRTDGQVVNREHLLMALSSIDAIYIKATYTTSTKDGALKHVAIDIATPNNIGTSRAVEVEECRCPAGYVGLSCERCADGYKRVPEAGLYLGVCEPCKCNGHSEQCDPETGVCFNCADNTAGEFCERCAPGYVGNASGGTPYDCSPDYNQGQSQSSTPETGYNQTNCRYCNQAGTASCDDGYCQCKSNVFGVRCDQCRPGTYDLSERHPQGCKECYCSGKSQQCRSSTLYRQLIPVDFFSNTPLITDEDGNLLDNEHLHFSVDTNSYEYNFTSFEPRYWSLRGAVLGNQLMSYGGELTFNLQVDSYGPYETGNDVILIGNGQKLLWSRPSNQQNDPFYHVRLHEDENWQRLDRGYASTASRHDLMSVLSNLEHILIRGTTKLPTTRTVIRDVILESAIEHPTADGRVATEVEICSCPPGYIGNTCESCAPLHYSDANGDCQVCPCQEDTTQSCNLDSNGYVACQCKSGYSGDRCQNEASYPVPEPTTAQPQPDYDYRTQITVAIAPPEITIIPVGGSVTLTCTGRLAYSGHPVVVNWYKLNGQLPSYAEINDGILRLYDLQLYDSGIYRCQAVNNQTAKIFEDEVSITITESSQRTPAQIINLPQVVIFEEYQPNEIDCGVVGNPTPVVTWTRVDGQMSNEVRTEETRLIFNSPRVTDEGNYRCYATNSIGADQRLTQISVRPAAVGPLPPPREYVYIEPASYTGGVGEPIRLTCVPTAAAPLVYEWNKDGYPVYRQRNIIVNGNILEIRDSSTRDSGTYTCIGIDQRNNRNYTANVPVHIEDNRLYPEPPQPQPGAIQPVVNNLASETLIIQGRDLNITCEATGTPTPKIRWTKLHEALAENVHPIDNVLFINKARIENRGMYVCIAENPAGSGQQSTFIEIEPREHPTVEIQPLEPQVVHVGYEGVLYCRGMGIPEPRVHWRRLDGQPMSPRAKEQSPGYVVIDNLQVSDTGDYECVAENEVGHASAITSIRVVEAPQIQVQPNEEILRLREGDNTRIICTATGTPTPQVQWVSEDDNRAAPINQQSSEAVLELSRLSRFDSKSYKCIAANEAGTVDRYITLDVRPAWDASRGDAPDDGDYDPQPEGDRPADIYRANSGEEVKLTCDLVNPQDLNEKIRTLWERVDGRPMAQDVHYDRNTLIIARVDEQHTGLYRCKGFNASAAVVGEYIADLQLVPIPHITFHPKMPIVVSTNENVEIFCEVTGEQPIQVSWHAQNNRPLPSSVEIDGQYLRFRAITPADAGHYYCSAANRYGNATEIAEVLVNRGAAYTKQPQSRRYDIPEGEDVTMTCDISQSGETLRAPIEAKWRREDGRFFANNVIIKNQALYLRAVRPENEGRYICELTSAGRTFSPSIADLYIKREYPYQYQNGRRRSYRKK